MLKGSVLFAECDLECGAAPRCCQHWRRLFVILSDNLYNRYALDVVNQGMQEKQSITVRCVDIEDLEKQAEAIRIEQIKLYELYADGVLLRDAYGCF